jgi:hypothetical protein
MENMVHGDCGDSSDTPAFRSLEAADLPPERKVTSVRLGDLSYYRPATRIMRCSKGHQWEENPSVGQMYFAGPSGEHLCYKCISEFMAAHCGTVEEVREPAADAPAVAEPIHYAPFGIISCPVAWREHPARRYTSTPMEVTCEECRRALPGIWPAADTPTVIEGRE